MASSSSSVPVDGPSAPGMVKAMENRTPEWVARWGTLHEAYMMIWQTNLQGPVERVMAKAKTDIFSAIIMTEIGLWEFNFGEAKHAAKELEARIDHLEKISESRVDKNEPSFFGPDPNEKQLALWIEGLVGLAYSHMARALFHFRRNSYVKGGYNLRKAWVTLKDAFEALQVQQKSNFAQDEEIIGCINFGMGFFNFLVSLVPPTFQFLVKILGFEGDRAAALGQFAKARETRCLKRIEATLGLFAIRRYFTDDEEAADVLLEEMLEDYPDSPMVLYICALMFRFKAQTDRSLSLLQHAVSKAEHDQMRFTLNYHLATTYVMTAQYERALEHHKVFLDGTSGEQFKVWASYQCGICHWLIDMDRQAVSPYFRFVLKEGKSDQPLDKIAMRKAKEYFKANESFSEYHTRLLRIQHIHEGQLWQQVLDLVKELLKIAVTTEERAVCFYYKASAYEGLKKHQKAQKYYQQVLINESFIKGENYNYIVPYTWAEMGEAELHMGNLARAKELFKKAKKYDDYDWNNLLSVRISSDLDKLHRREAALKNGTAPTAPDSAPNSAPTTPRASTSNGTTEH